MSRTPQRKQDRTVEEATRDAGRLISSHEEFYAALAWDGYQHSGRGTVLCTEEMAKYVPLADTPTLQLEPRNHVALRALIAHYDPQTTVCVMVFLPATATRQGYHITAVAEPKIPPPLARANLTEHIVPTH